MLDCRTEQSLKVSLNCGDKVKIESRKIMLDSTRARESLKKKKNKTLFYIIYDVRPLYYLAQKPGI